MVSARGRARGPRRRRRPRSSAGAGRSPRSRAPRRTPGRRRCPTRTSSSIRSAPSVVAWTSTARSSPPARPVRRCAGVTEIRWSSATSATMLTTACPTTAPSRSATHQVVVGTSPATPATTKPNGHASGPRLASSRSATAGTSSGRRPAGAHRAARVEPGLGGVGTAQVERVGLEHLGPPGDQGAGQPAGAGPGRVHGVREGVGVEPGPLARHRQVGGRVVGTQHRRARAPAPRPVVRREVDLLAPGVRGDHGSRRRPRRCRRPRPR